MTPPGVQGVPLIPSSDLNYTLLIVPVLLPHTEHGGIGSVFSHRCPTAASRYSEEYFSNWKGMRKYIVLYSYFQHKQPNCLVKFE